MKVSGLRWTRPGRLGLRVALLAALPAFLAWVGPEAAGARTHEARITSAYRSGGELVVAAEVPDGTVRATLEFRAQRDAGAWRPVAARHLDGSVTTVVFRIPFPQAEKVGLLRVRAANAELLPAGFYSGESTFEGSPSSGWGLAFDGATPGAGEEGVSDAEREVAESDIWKLDGDTLYFFNQMRGLQVFDVSDPDAPVLSAALSAPAAGEQMYVVGDHAVLLLRGGSCAWWAEESETVIGIVDVSGGDASVVAQAPVEGWYQESRMVGSVLYVATSAYRPVATDPDGSDPSTGEPTGTIWEYGTLLSAFDLSDPATPVARDELWFPGWGNVVSATPRFFFVAVTEPETWRRMIIHVADISDPLGAMSELGSIPLAGVVADKFKLHLGGNVFTTISEARDAAGGLRTVLETFDVSDPARPAPLGELRLAEGERLHATRFDGDRVYVVTFEQIDPLWIVDLSDPAHPAVVGELEVPGWSTHIEPRGDRLVSVGIDNEDGWRVAVSLFDVGDPAAPSLLDRVTVGEEWSWSEATSDEKAFGVLEEAGLVLLPFQSQEGSCVQLIDLDMTNGRLEKRGTIRHEIQARRATVHRERILSVSGRELVTVDAADRDDPVVTSRLELAWTVDRIFLAGAFVIEVEANSGGWDVGSGPMLRVADAGDPERIAGAVQLEGPPVLGGAVRDEVLFVAQADPDAPWVCEDETWVQNDASLILSIWDLGALPELRLLGREEIGVKPLGWGTRLETLFPLDGVLVLASVAGNSGWVPWLYGPLDMVAMPEGGFVGGPWYWGGAGGRLVAFDVADPAEPRHLSTVDLRDGDDWDWGAGSHAFTEAGSIYLSHRENVLVEHPLPDDPDSDGSSGLWWEWMSFWYLDVVDYEDAAHPTVRAPTALPSELVGLGRGGDLLYAFGSRWNETRDWIGEFVSACAYDGVNAYRIDEIPLPESWPHPVVVDNESVVIGSPEAKTEGTPPALETWVLSDAGRFVRTQVLSLPSPAEELAVLGNVLVARSSDRRVVLTGWDSPGTLAVLGDGGIPGCAWYLLAGGDGDRARGVWIPLGAYGVGAVPVASP